MNFQVKTLTDKSAASIRSAVEMAMSLNGRKQNFDILARRLTGELIVSPSADYIETGRREEWCGLSFVRRALWFSVPGYAENVIKRLRGIMGEKTGEGA